MSGLDRICTDLHSYLRQISAPAVITNLTQTIPLLSALLSVGAPDERCQLSALEAISALASRLRDAKAFSGLKASFRTTDYSTKNISLKTFNYILEYFRFGDTKYFSV